MEISKVPFCTFTARPHFIRAPEYYYYLWHYILSRIGIHFDDEPVSDLGRLSPGAIADFARHDDKRARAVQLFISDLATWGEGGFIVNFQRGTVLQEQILERSKKQSPQKQIFLGVLICIRQFDLKFMNITVIPNRLQWVKKS